MDYTTLNIIGNGFDRFHGLPTAYFESDEKTCFCKWLKDNNKEVYDKLCMALGNPYSGPQKNEAAKNWCSFEAELGKINTVELRKKIVQKGDWKPGVQAEPTLDDFEEADSKGMDIDELYNQKHKLPASSSENMEVWITVFKNGLQIEFEKWVKSITVSDAKCKAEIELENAIFLSFNYTTTLEQLYNIDSQNIFHIHGVVPYYPDDEDEESQYDPINDLVFGHGNEDCALSGIQNILYHTSKPRMKTIEGNRVLNEGLQELQKPVNDIIERSGFFFDKLSELRDVYVYGFSFGDVDMPYIRRIMEIAPKAKWHISCLDKNNYKPPKGLESAELFTIRKQTEKPS